MKQSRHSASQRFDELQEEVLSSHSNARTIPDSEISAITLHKVTAPSTSVSIDQGPFKGLEPQGIPTELPPEGGVLLGPERPRTYDDLNDDEKKRYDADVCATNIVLQGLPKDIYKLINHNIEAKAIWDNGQNCFCRATHPTDKPATSNSSNTKQNQVTIQDGQIVWIRNVQGPQNPNQRNFARVEIVTAGWGMMRNRAGNANEVEGKTPTKWCSLDEDELLFLAGDRATTFDADVIINQSRLSTE
ncbi:hypothetical protein Tco_0871046 [Tanacetum coccineum]